MVTPMPYSSAGVTSHDCLSIHFAYTWPGVEQYPTLTNMHGKENFGLSVFLSGTVGSVVALHTSVHNSSVPLHNFVRSGCIFF